MIATTRGYANDEPLGRPVRPAPGEPGTLGQQWSAVGLSLYLAARRRSTARDEWDDARRLVMPHAADDGGDR